MSELPSPAPRLVGLERMADPRSEDEMLVRLNRNERLEPLPEAFLERIRSAIRSDLLTGYPATDELYAELAASLGVDRARLLLTPGSDGAIKALFETYVRPGDGVVSLSPSYAMYEVYSQMFGVDLAQISFGAGMTIDATQLVESIQSGVRLVLLANPNQPTGTLLAPVVLKDVLARAAAVGALVAVDEAYYPFSATTVVPWTPDFPHLVVLRTFSKAAGLAGLRIGYAVGHPDVVRNLAKVRTAHDVNAVAVLCAREILASPDIVDECVASIDAGKQVLLRRMQELALATPRCHTNFQLIQVAPRRPPAQVVAELRARGYLVRGPFESSCLAGCIRVTLGPAELMERFADALADVITPR